MKIWIAAIVVLGAFVAGVTHCQAADCTTALKTIFVHEGGYQCQRSDSGNWTGGKVGKGVLKGTKYGISAASYPNVDIKALNLDTAAKYYLPDFWRPLQLDACKSQGLATTFLDTGVNAGVGTAAIIMEETVNYLNGNGRDWPRRGYITPTQMFWINEYTASKENRQLFYLVFQSIRSEHYARIAKADPNKRRYLADWLIRTWS